MLTIEKSQLLAEHLQQFRRGFKRPVRVGFVPTMGALHQGHLSLIEIARKQCDIVVCSIFINPTQFNDSADLQNYPRTIQEDKQKLVEAECDLLYAPEVDDVYPEGAPKMLTIDFGTLETVMEGVHRPGHFKGMATVVHRLFNIVIPDIVFMGEKDYQQLCIVKKMVQLLNMNIDVVGCPTLREKDGLAMSSRNVHLTPAERKASVKLSKTLFRAQEDIHRNTIEQTKEFAMATLLTDPLLSPEYFEIVNAETLQPVKTKEGATSLRALTAVRVGNTRLIDNMAL